MRHKFIRRSINKKRKKSGFRTLMKEKNGCKIIKMKRRKGRKLL